jgi:hypothetical protein
MRTQITLLTLAAVAAAAADVSVWNGGAGNWNSAANWTPAVVPNGASAVVRIDGEAGAASAVTLDLSPSVGGLTLDAGDSLTIANGRSLTVYGGGGGLTNDGALALNSSGSITYLVFSGRQSLVGAGEIVMGNHSYNEINLIGTDKVLTQDAGHTIRGAGRLLDNTGNLINCGNVRAQGSVALTVDPLSFFINEGTLRAEGSGGLTLAAGAYTNAGHTIEALDGSRVTIQNAASVVGGTLASVGTGRFWPADGARLDGVALAAGTVVTQANGVAVTVLGGLENNGRWHLAASSGLTDLTLSGSQTLSGSGELVLGNHVYNEVRMGASGQTLTHGAGHTIRGAGALLDNVGNLVNEGTILAQGSQTLILDPYAYVVNAGTLRAEGSGGLTLAAGAYTNDGHVIEANAGSKVTLHSSATVYGGTLASADTGRLVPQSGARLHGITLASGTTVTHANGAAITVTGGLTNRGRWNQGASMSITTLTFSGDQTLDGDGEIVLTDHVYNHLALGAAAQTLTHGEEHTIRGAGALLNNSGNLVNEGTILAQGAVALTIDPSPSFVNVGTLRAEGTGGLTLGAGAHTNVGHTIEVMTGSKLKLVNGTVLYGGTLAGAGQLLPASGARLHDVTLADGTAVAHANGASITITGGLVNRGRWNLNTVNAITTLSFSGEQTLSGAGELVLADNTYSRVTLGATSQTLTHGSAHTIRGSGLLLNNTGDLDNYGRLLAVGARKMTINPATSFRNLGTGVLGGTGTFEFTDGLANNAGTIAPGLSVGTLTIIGDVSNASSALFDFELGGTGAGQSDKLVVQGALALDGELRVAFANGYIPEPEDAVVILSATALSGAFANAVPLAGTTASNVLTDVGTCDVTYDYTSASRTVTVSNMRPNPSLLRAVGVGSAGVVRTIQFAPSAEDWLYTLQRRPSLGGGDWADVPGQGPRPGIGRRDLMTDTNAPAAAGFYRVRGAPAVP